MVFEGTAELDAERMFPDLLAKGVPGADKVTLDEFRHWASLVRRQLNCLCLHEPTCATDWQQAVLRRGSLVPQVTKPQGWELAASQLMPPWQGYPQR
jgi:hypothetical protein